MSKGVERPTYGDVYSQSVTVVALAIKDLPHPRLSSRHVVVQHDVISTNYLEPSLFHILAECGGLLRISLQKRPNVGHLIENKSKLRMVTQEGKHSEDVRKADIKILFASFEHGAFPMRVGNNPERVLCRVTLLGGGGIRSRTCLRLLNFKAGENEPTRQY